MPPKQCNQKLKIEPSLTSGHFSLAHNIWGKTFRHLGQHLPQVFAYYHPLANDFPWLQTLLRMGDYAHFFKDPGWWDESTLALWGLHNICPFLSHFQMAQMTWPELSALSCAGAWEDPKKPQCNMAFLLIVPGKAVGEEMAFGLVMVWMHPHQACLSSLDKVVRKLALLINLGDNWAYAFLWLNENAQHIPLPDEGHLSKSVCGHLCQLEVHKLLQDGDQVVNPEGLNGGLEPLQTSLSGPLLWGQVALGDSTCEPSFLLVDPFQATLGDCIPEAPTPCRTSTPSSPSHLTMEHPLKTDSHISMTAEVQELLSHAELDTSSQALGDSTPERPTSAALGAPPSARMEDSSKPVATFPQASPWVALPDDAVPISHSSPTTPMPETPRAAGISATLPSKTSTGDDTGTLPKEVLHLQGEMNRIMGWLLMTRASMGAHQRKEVSDFQMALHQNEAWTTEAIREAEAMHAAAIREVKACWTNII